MHPHFLSSTSCTRRHPNSINRHPPPPAPHAPPPPPPPPPPLNFSLFVHISSSFPHPLLKPSHSATKPWLKLEENNSSSQPRWRPSSPAQTTSLLPAPTEPAVPAPSTALPSPTVPKYTTRAGPVPTHPSYPRPARRQPPSKRVRTSSLGESSLQQPQVPQQPSPPPGAAYAIPKSDSPSSAFRRPLFPCATIERNTDCINREFHDEKFYDIPAFANQPELQDSMELIHCYSLEPFMTSRRFFYPRVVIDFYQTMTSRGERHPIALHFTIDGRQGILRAADIAASFQLPVTLSNSTDFKKLSYPSRREMVQVLSRNTSTGPILYRRQLLSGMLFVDHMLRSNLFPLQHII